MIKLQLKKSYFKWRRPHTNKNVKLCYLFDVKKEQKKGDAQMRNNETYDIISQLLGFFDDHGAVAHESANQKTKGTVS